jgi:preprotein translocase subunit SecY
MFRRLLLVFTDPELRSKVIKILALLIVARLLAHIPIPILKVENISEIIESDAVLGLLNTLAGGGYGRLSFVLLGIGPYITASIVMQLLTVLSPRLADIQKNEGDAGQRKINQWTRMLTVPLAALQSWGILQFLASGNLGAGSIELPEVLASNQLNWQTFGYWSVVIISMTAGSIIMMWIGEIITEFKMGNGISLLILSGIVSSLPSQLNKFWQDVRPNLQELFSRVSIEKITNWEVWKAFLYYNQEWNSSRIFFLFIIIFVIALLLVTFMNDAVRKIPIIYSRRGHSEGNSRTLSKVQADLPLKVNIAGVFPIIFAVSFVLFPTFIARFMATSNIQSLRTSAAQIEAFLSTQPNQTESGFRPSNLPNGLLGFYGTSSKDDLEAAIAYDPTEGQDIFGFTLTTIEGTNNVLFNDTFLEFSFASNDLGFLPEYAFYFQGWLAYNFFYFLLIVFFTYFYTANIIFKTDDVAERLQNYGAYIPGYRPGKETKEYLDYVSNRLNVAGSVFLALIAVVPILMGSNLRVGDGTINSIVGGTTLLILVSVTIETLKQIEAQATSIDYERFTKY